MGLLGNRNNGTDSRGGASGTSSQPNVDLRRLHRVDLIELLVADMDTIETLKANCLRLQNMLTSTEATNKRLIAKLDDKDAQIERLKGKLDAKDAQFERLKRRLDDKDAQLSRLTGKLDEKDAQLERLKGRLDDKDRQIERLQALAKKAAHIVRLHNGGGNNAKTQT